MFVLEHSGMHLYPLAMKCGLVFQAPGKFTIVWFPCETVKIALERANHYISESLIVINRKFNYPKIVGHMSIVNNPDFSTQS